MDANQVKTGTTTVGLKTKDIIVLAADMKATMGHIAYDEESKKLYKITNTMAVTNAGSVGDSMTIIRFLKGQAKLYEIERETRMSAKAATTLLSNVLNGNRYFPFIVQLLIGGVNSKTELFEITPYGDVIERERYGATGSGTELALSVLDQSYKDAMPEEEAVKLAIRAINAGRRRDVFSGGVSVSVMVIDKNGVREIPRKQVEKLM